MSALIFLVWIIVLSVACALVAAWVTFIVLGLLDQVFNWNLEIGLLAFMNIGGVAGLIFGAWLALYIGQPNISFGGFS